MKDLKQIIFVSDVHLGLKNLCPEEREERFLSFLKQISREETEAVYLLGDIWDFWYEYRDVVPRTGMRVVAEFVSLMDAGVKLYFCRGNHDIWTFSFFEELGVRIIEQPYVFEYAGKRFCVGHGDTLGGAKPGYRFMQAIFHCRFVQRLFSTLHPWFAYRLGLGWSGHNRKSHKPYSFRGADEPLYKFALEYSGREHIDYFVFGHFHDNVDLSLPSGARLVVLKDWLSGQEPCAVFGANGFELRS